MSGEPRSIFEVCNALSPIEGSGGSVYALVPWQIGWTQALVAAWLDPEIAYWNPVPPEPTLELAQSWISGTAEQNEASIGIDVVLASVADAAVAGEIGLQIDPSQGIAEVGFWLAEDFRGKGLGKTLLGAAQDLAAELELAGLVALVDPDNRKAISLLEAMAWPELPTKSHRRAFAYRTP